MTTTTISDKDYDSLQQRYQSIWFQCEQLNALVEKLQNRVEELEETLRYEQDYK